MRNPTLPLGLSLLLLVSHLQSLQASAEQSPDQKQNVQDAKARAQPAATTATDTAKTLLPGHFILQEGFSAATIPTVIPATWLPPFASL